MRRSAPTNSHFLRRPRGTFIYQESSTSCSMVCSVDIPHIANHNDGDASTVVEVDVGCMARLALGCYGIGSDVDTYRTAHLPCPSGAIHIAIDNAAIDVDESRHRCIAGIDSPSRIWCLACRIGTFDRAVATAIHATHDMALAVTDIHRLQSAVVTRECNLIGDRPRAAVHVAVNHASAVHIDQLVFENGALIAAAKHVAIHMTIGDIDFGVTFHQTCRGAEVAARVEVDATAAAKHIAFGRIIDGTDTHAAIVTVYGHLGVE